MSATQSCMHFLMYLSITVLENWTCLYSVFHNRLQFLAKKKISFFQYQKIVLFRTTERRKTAFGQFHLMQPKSHTQLIKNHSLDVARLYYTGIWVLSWCWKHLIHKNLEFCPKADRTHESQVAGTPPEHREPLSFETTH